MVHDAASALGAMLRAATLNDHDELLKAANAAIKADKQDWTAHQTRVVALLKLDRFDEAVAAISQAGGEIEARCVVEKAYALYKTGRLQEAAAVVQSCGLGGSRSLNHIAAQVAYRAQDFPEAQAIYARLVAQDAHIEAADIEINVEAIRAQLQWQQRLSNVPPLCHDDSFELCYNMACREIARAALPSAASLLQRSVRLCDGSDELTDAERKAELKAILAQQAYVHGRLGNKEQALHLCRSVDLSEKNTDGELSLILHNNMMAFDTIKPSNPFLLERHAAAYTSAAAKSSLFGFQTALMTRNSALIHLWMHKTDGVRRATRKTMANATHPTSSLQANTASVLLAAAETSRLQSKQLLRKVALLFNKHPNNVGLALLNIQLLLSRDKLATALSVLETFLGRLDQPQFQHVRFSPGLVALAVALMRANGRHMGAKLQLAKAASFWCAQPASIAASLLQEAGVELAKSSNAQDLSLAALAFDKLGNQEQESRIASAGLVAALAASDMSRVQHHLAQLPSVQSLTASVDVDALVDSGVPIVASRAIGPSKRPVESADSRASKKRRRTKTKLQNIGVEGKVLDPERWLPLRDRSSYRPKGRRAKKKAADLTQGGIVKEEQRAESLGRGGVNAEKTVATASSKKKKGKR
ncbi:hypothetical protein CDD82_297 [Ophiocordyceps australis]|uniref:Signal recognition particle subunit SRP72 n=1 Tax=Ophiocordyceps australis TaxID=1399860 RepID=A0A2C5XS81_9HYPO|nr:hypothetical protein CDD82_297 [Ophiocordyceps australis]